MLDFIVTASIEATEGLLDESVLKIWIEIRTGILIYLQSYPLTAENREAVVRCFKNAGKGLEGVGIFLM